MSCCLRFTCNKCGYSLKSWDSGNPYIEFPEGKRNYLPYSDVYQEGREFVRKILGYEPSREEVGRVMISHGGHAPTHRCRNCNAYSRIDSKKDPLECPKCKSSEVEEIFKIGGNKCFKCDGTFSEGEVILIS